MKLLEIFYRITFKSNKASQKVSVMDIMYLSFDL